MLAGINKSLGIAEPEKKSVFNLGATGDKLKAAGNKIAAGEVPTFTEESAFSKCCPNLTMKQVGWLLGISLILTSPLLDLRSVRGLDDYQLAPYQFDQRSNYWCSESFAYCF